MPVGNVSISELHADIREAVAAAFTAASVPLQHPNGRSPEPNSLGLWGAYQIQEFSQDQESFGNPGANAWRHRGEVDIHLFGPAGAGEGVLLSVAGAIAAAFRGAIHGAVTFTSAAVRTRGLENGRWSLVISAGYFADERA